MNATTKRPVFLDLFRIKLPAAGIMSIVHRITGVLMIFATPVLVWLLDRSVSSADGFAGVAAFLGSGAGLLLVFLGLWAVFHHLFAGLRYLLIDMDVGVDKPLFQQTALAVLVSAPVVAAIVTGVLR
jgi:succinate dehydrogenase / fumarate reductase cytochrome b subunit